MNKKDEQIERKLIELETSVANESQKSVTDPKQPGHQLLETPETATNVKSDLYYFAGLGLVLTGILMMFNHIRLGTGFFAMLGMGGQGFGLLLIPLLVGIGWIFYDSKSKGGYAVLALTIGLIIFGCLSSLVMTFPSMTLLGIIMMLLPLALGGALLVKSAGGPAGIKQKMRDDNLLK
jgi:hypothetical protein